MTLNAKQQDVQDQLNRMNPASNHAKLGDVLVDLINGYNDLVTKYQALLGKLDADAGVTDTNYTSLESAKYLSITTLDKR